MFFNKHKQKNVIIYKKIFIIKIKLLLSYFAKFSNNRFKIYPNNCILKKSNKKLIIIIINNKTIISTNNNC